MTAPLLLVALFVIGLAGRPAAAQSPVQVTVYYESLCPYCQQFISGTLKTAWGSVPEIMDVQFVPWGNARATQTSSGWQIQCQHGASECYYNAVHACALSLAPSQSAGVNFIICMDSSNQDTAACAAQTGVDGAAVAQCATDPATTELLLHYRDVTDAARPQIRGVPTIAVNGSQDRQDQIRNNLLAVVCSEYQGPKPAAC